MRVGLGRTTQGSTGSRSGASRRTVLHVIPGETKSGFSQQELCRQPRYDLQSEGSLRPDWMSSSRRPPPTDCGRAPAGRGAHRADIDGRTFPELQRPVRPDFSP